MASRKTETAALELKTQFQSRHPDREIRVVDRSGTRSIGRAVATRLGFEIVTDEGGVTVTVKETRFDVLEVRNCRSCNCEILTAAIGEDDSYNQCTSCREKSHQAFSTDLAACEKVEAEQMAETVWRDEWEE